jgi:hypothetical protein
MRGMAVHSGYPCRTPARSAAVAARARPLQSRRAGARRAGGPPAAEVQEVPYENNGAAGQLVGRDLPDPRLACRSW